MTPNLPELRIQIDKLDRELLTLLNQRARVAEAVGEVKRREGSPFFRPDRVAAVIEKIQQANTGPLKNEHVEAIWREIMSACLALETPVRVAYLGPAGTFSEQAALQFFGASIEHVPCSSIDEVFRATAGGSANYGVVPVENSTEGVVSRSLDLFLNSPLHIVGETSLMVRHNLLRLSDSLDGIEAVYAHPQALAQCQGWLTAHLPNAERRTASSNAEGARLATTNPAWAGIASERAGGQFGLHNAAHAIQDDAFNRTRFAVVCLPQTLPAPAASGKDCISLIVSVPNRPGAVHDILGPLKTHGVSMTRFESRPARSGQWEYFFYIDLQGHPSQPHVSAAMAELQQMCAFFKVLGTYPPAIEAGTRVFKQLGLIGCGLMGSSFALALKRAALVEHVRGFSPSPATTALALKMGVIDSVATSAADAASGADLVLLAVPVAATQSTLQTIADAIDSHTLVMDVGSTKQDVVLVARETLGQRLPCFVPAHPICGKEVSGVQNADVDLYTGKKVILTPLPETAPAQLALALQLWQALGTQVSQMNPAAHDAAYAAVSHLPHLLAFAMINSLQGQDQGEQYMALAGSGFRDFTRIAASEPAMWRDILLANRNELLAQSHLFQQSLQALEKLITAGDAAQLHSAITQASAARTRWAQSPGSSSPHQD